MTIEAKNKVREYFNTNYGQQMLEIYGLKIVKKEIFHARKNYGCGLGDKRQTKFYIND